MKHILTLIFVLCAAHLSAQEAHSILRNMIRSFERHESLNYEATMRKKHLGKDDTTTRNGKVFLQRAKDSLFGGRIWYTTDDTYYKFYDLQYIYLVDHKEKKATVYKAHEQGEWALKGNSSYDLVWDTYLDATDLEERIKHAKQLRKLADTTIGNYSCYTVLLQSADDDDVTERFRTYYINKKDYFPILWRASLKYQGNYQYNERLATSYAWDNVSESQFSPRQIPGGYAVDTFVMKEMEPQKLDSGATAPTITGRHYQAGLAETTINFKGKITVLDFWYMGCHPCVLAIPKIEKLKEKYKDNPRVQIFGLNAYDTDSADIARLPKFIDYNPIHYPIILLPDRKMAETDYKVKAWPTFYIIDEKGAVAFSTIGYDENLFTDLSNKIDELLQR
ncbi:MAG: TlpA family protein disulfide reductase [Flavipsychrobacter sp.]|nr:TlpA family protein disulfide reductase [Flavipsychrobacter sp.]